MKLNLSLRYSAGVLGVPSVDIESLFPFPIHRGRNDVGMEALNTVGVRGSVDDTGMGQIQGLPAASYLILQIGHGSRVTRDEVASGTHKPLITHRTPIPRGSATPRRSRQW